MRYNPSVDGAIAGPGVETLCRAVSVRDALRRGSLLRSQLRKRYNVAVLRAQLGAALALLPSMPILSSVRYSRNNPELVRISPEWLLPTCSVSSPAGRLVTMSNKLRPRQPSAGAGRAGPGVGSWGTAAVDESGPKPWQEARVSPHGHLPPSAAD